MKCPYNGFKECIVEKCPSCNYTKKQETEIRGKWQPWISTEEALENGNAWKETRTKYQFVSCKLIDNNVPIPEQTNVVHEHHVINNTAVVVKQGLINL